MRLWFSYLLHCVAHISCIKSLLLEMEGRPDISWMVEAPIPISSCSTYQPLLGTLSFLKSWKAIWAICLKQQSV